MPSSELEAAEVMAFETANWRWHSDTARKDARRKPPEPVRVTLRHWRVAEGFIPPEDGLEQIAEALENAVQEALGRAGSPRRSVRAVLWSGGYGRRDDYVPTWTDSGWKVFDEEEPGPLASVKILVSTAEDVEQSDHTR